MKICILSMQNVQNMGSVLQSYSLRKILLSLGHEVCFIPIEPRAEDNILLGGYSESFSVEAEAGYKKKPFKKLDLHLLVRILNKIKRKKQFLIYDDFRKTFHLNDACDEIKEGYYDLCVIGSDEVFNCLSRSSWGFTSQLFGNIKNAKNVMTYAASCGSTKAENVPVATQNCISVALAKLKAISVRDENTRTFVKKISNRESLIHLDPVLIGNFDNEISAVNLNIKLPKKYCVIYSYDNRIHKKGEIDSIKLFCKSHGMTPVCVGIPQFWIRHYYTVNPFECLKIFSGAEFVITDTFHGTIFSTKYCDRFCVLVRGSNINKLQDLIDRLSLEKHQAEEITFSNLEQIYSVCMDKETYSDTIEKEYERSLDYLKSNIEDL